ncbi:MAG: rane protein [Nocardioidaceae bacterium]|nr:rane protein [Nocardioidaceae bacterium]
MELRQLPVLALRTVRRLPLTVGLVVACPLVSLLVMLVHGRSAVAYGLPAALEGHWWTFGIGALVVPTMALAPLLAGLVALAVGPLESRVGTRRTAYVVAVTHLAGTAGAAAVLQVGRLLPWPWAHGLAQLGDVGPSAAGVGALAVLATTLRRPLRHTLLTAASAYLVVMLVCSGRLWDLEHLIAFGAGLLLAPYVTGRTTAPGHPTSRLGLLRRLAALLVVTGAVAAVVQVWFPGYGGPLGHGPADTSGGLPAALALLLLAPAFVLGDGLRRGARWAWPAATSAALAGLLLALPMGWTAGTLVCLAATLALALLHRRTVRSGKAPVVASVDVRARLLRDGGGTLGWQHTWAGSETWTSPDGEVLICFRRSAGVAIVVGDPVGPRFRWYAASRTFVEHCRTQGLVPAWYAVTDTFLRETGLEEQSFRVGEDARIELAGLELRGKAWQDVRTARNHAARDGIVVLRLDPTSPDGDLLGQVREISSAWADDKPLPEMCFTLGGVRESLDPDVRTYVAVDTENVVHGVVSWLPVHRDGRVVGWTLDLMRRRSTGFRPVMELLIAESLLAFRDEGYESASLSVAPLARADGPRGTVERLLDASSATLEPLYGFGSLLAFKRKFSPELRPVHLAYESGIDLPRIAVAVGRAYLPHVTPREAWTAVRTVLVARRTEEPRPVVAPRAIEPRLSPVAGA